MVTSASFIADTATFDKIEGTLLAGLAAGDGSQGYLLLQRCAPDDQEDWGIHLEYNDQALSGYNTVASCRLSRERFEVDLSKPLANLEGITGIDIELNVDEASFERFSRGLKQVFRGEEGSLTIR